MPPVSKFSPRVTDPGAGLGAPEKPDLVVLDLMLPGMDGLDLCRTLRHESNVPIIMLTAADRGNGQAHRSGAGGGRLHHQAVQPAGTGGARAARCCGGQAEDPSSEVIRSREDLVLDRTRYQVILPDRSVVLTATEFELLATMMSQPGRIFTRAQLLTAVRGVAFESYERAD